MRIVLRGGVYFLICIVLLRIPEVEAGANSETPSASNARAAFISNPTLEGWRKLVSEGRQPGAELYASAALLIDQYNELRVHRDLPNSMSRDNVDEFLLANSSELHSTFIRLNQLDPAVIRDLEISLCNQRFSEELVWSSGEILFRMLGKAAFQATKQQVNPENLKILKKVEERFEAGNGRIGYW